MSEKPKPLVYLLDDDPAFIYLMEHILKKLGIATEGFTLKDAFLARVRERAPRLCLIDLNLSAPLAGYEIIETIRATVSPSLPIVVISSEAEKDSVAHAIELGANDYLFKPLDRQVLLAKVSNFVMSPELEMSVETAQTAPESTVPVQAGLEAKISRIEETGITLLSPHLISKGTVIQLRGELVDEIVGPGKYILATAIATSVDAGDRYSAYLEFDSAQSDVASLVRTWISKQRSSGTSQ